MRRIIILVLFCMLLCGTAQGAGQKFDFWWPWLYQRGLDAQSATNDSASWTNWHEDVWVGTYSNQLVGLVAWSNAYFPEWIQRDGSIPMTGNLDFDGNNAVGVNNIQMEPGGIYYTRAAGSSSYMYSSDGDDLYLVPMNGKRVYISGGWFDGSGETITNFVMGRDLIYLSSQLYADADINMLDLSVTNIDNMAWGATGSEFLFDSPGLWQDTDLDEVYELIIDYNERHLTNGWTLFDGVGFAELSSDPADPPEGEAIFWMSDGTGTGDDGDIILKIKAGGVTKTITWIDYSAF